jgi:hypothetical protein
MAEESKNEASEPARQKYQWPWFVLGAVLLGIALSILWLSCEVERTRRIRDLNTAQPPIITNSNGPSK